MSEAFYCQTQDLAIGYGKTPLLQNIGIGVQRGQILALIGPNGAGKSTLLKTLAGQLAAQSGAVLLQGQNLTTYTPNARAHKMALMLPHTRHTELTTCFDVAAAGRYPYTGRLGILSEQDRMQVRDALHLGLRNMMNASPVMDKAVYMRELEQGYMKIWQSYLESRK